MQIAASDASYPVLRKFKWERSFHGMASTPLSPAQISDGTLLWIALRSLVNSALYLAILSASARRSAGRRCSPCLQRR